MKYESYLAVVLLTLSSLSAAEQAPIQVLKEVPAQPTERVEKKESEDWKKVLTPEQYKSLRDWERGEAFDAVWDQFSKQGPGTYYCAGCDTELLSSEHKFETKLGRPAFFRFIEPRKIHIVPSYSRGYKENSIQCATCGGFLGFLYTDEGYDVPEGKHYSLLGPSLKFLPKK